MLEVTRKENESTISVVRRFSQKVRRSGLVQAARGVRFRARTPSRLARKMQALRRLKRQERFLRLRKWGKVSGAEQFRGQR